MKRDDPSTTRSDGVEDALAMVTVRVKAGKRREIRDRDVAVVGAVAAKMQAKRIKVVVINERV